IDRAVAGRVNAIRAGRESALLREIDYLRSKYALKGASTPGIPEIVILRQSGRLAIPVLTRTRGGGNDIIFNLPLSAANGDGGWTPSDQQQLQAIINIVYPELKNVYGAPSWSGTVTVKNGDNMAPIMSDRNALWGGTYNVSTKEIIFAQYNHVNDKTLNLTQMMAIAFRGPASISYDAWERG